MRPGASTFACGAVLGIALGFVAGHVSVWSRFGQATDARAWDVTVEPGAFPRRTLPESLLGESRGGAVYFPDASQAESGTVHALAKSLPPPEATRGQPSDSPLTSAPDVLPSMTDAAPLDSGATAKQERSRAIIEQALPDATPQERDVWTDVLDGLPEDDAVGILRLWQRFSERGTMPADDSPGRPPRSGSTPHPLHPPRIWPAALRCDETSQGLLSARSLILHNVANAHTIGFRRSVPVFASGDHQHGATLAGARLDHTPGRIVETGGPLDLAIDGEGFFVVREGDQTWFTRSGRLRIGPQGRLMLGESGSAYALDPPIQVPTGTEQITISADGRVAARGLNAAEATELGRIELALFLEPTRLAARSDSLFELTPESGPAHLGQPATDGRGALRQACLEQSNVRLRHELSELRRLEAQLDAIARTPVGYPPISKRGPEVPRDISGQLGE